MCNICNKRFKNIKCLCFVSKDIWIIIFYVCFMINWIVIVIIIFNFIIILNMFVIDLKEFYFFWKVYVFLNSLKFFKEY